MLHKPLGLSPQQAINRYRHLHPEYQSLKLGSVGRLDPMAEGLLVVMVGDENKNQSDYIGLDKTYEVEMLLGVSTDSYDLLGIPNKPLDLVHTLDRSSLDSAIARLRGKILQPYPPYSAVRVKSKPLYWWARQDRLNEVAIPIAERSISSLDVLSVSQIEMHEFRQDLTTRINSVVGDFRQAEILAAWDELLVQTEAEQLWNVKLRVVCSSGTFVRGLINQIGLDLRCGAVTRSIVRTKVGNWELKDANHLSINDM